MVHMAVVRSPHAHARLTAIDPAPALALPGVLAVFTFADLPPTMAPIPSRMPMPPGPERFLQYPLARDRVRYVGEPVALVVARDRYLAEDAVAVIEVAYESLPVVASVEAAIAAGAPRLHDAAEGNIAAMGPQRVGDFERARAEADLVIAERLATNRHTASPMETRGLLFEYDAGQQQLSGWGPAKCNHINRGILAGLLRLPESRIHLFEPDVGGGFGARGEIFPEDILVPFAAMRVGRPVKWIEDRRESLLATNHSREIECELQIAARRDGTILGLRARLVADMGAYVRTNGGVVPAKAAQFLPGPYRIPAFACEVRAVITNKTPVATYRGPGRFEANFFRERLMDLMAADLRLDPVEMRRKNLLTSAELPYSLGRLVPYEQPSEYDGGDYGAALARALEASDYARLARDNGRLVNGKLSGVGIGCFVESSGAGPAETARIVVKPGRVELYTGCASSGQGHETVMAQILADELAVPLDGITVFHGTTSFVDEGYGTYHSRAIVVGGSAVKAAAAKLAAQLVTLAAKRTGVDEARLESRGGNVYRRGRPDEPPVLALATLASEDSPDAATALTAVARFSPEKLTFTYGAHVAHVAVDPETGAVDVLRFVAVEDVGRAINPLLVHGQAHGAAVQGLGGAFMEELVYDETGQLLTGTFADYAMPTASAFPAIEAITLEDAPSTLNPLGAKGAGEGGIVATGAAAANAVAAALAPLGVVIRELPLSPANLARVIRDARRAR
jgi:carbon-monoxide dehydrogenase large subunit